MKLEYAMAVINKCLELLENSQRITLDTDDKTGTALLVLADSFSKVLLEQKQYELIVEIGDAQLTIAQYYSARREEEEARLQQARRAAQSGSTSALYSAPARSMTSSPIVRFSSPPRSEVSLGQLPPSPLSGSPRSGSDSEDSPPSSPSIPVRVEERKEAPKVEIFDESTLVKEVAVVNKTPGLKRKLRLDMTQKDASPILDLAGEYVVQLSDSSDSESEKESNRLMDATTELDHYFSAKSKGIARLNPARKTVLVY